MKNSKRLDYLNSHGRPVTRREFISRGLLAGGGVVLAPTLLSLLTRGSAHAQISNSIPFLVFDLIGGASMPGNFLVGRNGRPKDFLKSYNDLGWNPKKEAIDERFGLPMPDAKISKMFAGLIETMSAEAQKNFRFGSLLHVAQSDVPTNPLSALSLVAKSGNIGNDIASSLGLRPTLSGGYSRLAYEDESYRPHHVTKYEDISSALGVSGKLLNFSSKTKGAIVKMAGRLSSIQAKTFFSSKVDSATLQFIESKYGDAVSSASKSLVGDPRDNAIASQVYNINPQTASDNQSVLRAAIAHSVVSGLSGPGVISIGGCDYHDGTQTTGDNKDLEVGREIGRAVELAYRLKSPLMIQIITDGGISPIRGTRVWTADSVDTCMSVMGYFNPNQVPKSFDNRVQIGSYTDNQGADRNTLIGDSPLLAAYAAFANYMSVNNRIGEFSKIVPGVFSEADLDSVLLFES